MSRVTQLLIRCQWTVSIYTRQCTLHRTYQEKEQHRCFNGRGHVEGGAVQEGDSWRNTGQWRWERQVTWAALPTYMHARFHVGLLEFLRPQCLRFVWFSPSIYKFLVRILGCQYSTQGLLVQSARLWRHELKGKVRAGADTGLSVVSSQYPGTFTTKVLE
jgi:hypothetical protein